MAKGKRKRKRRVLVVLMSDMHCGHKLGLMSPSTQLIDHDGNPWTPSLTKVQEYLWELYLSRINDILALADGDEIIVIHNGDACQGVRYPSRWVSERESDQVKIAAQALAPWLELPNVCTMRIMVGTGAHNYGRGSAEVLLAEQLQALYPKASVKCLFHGLFTIAGVTIDAAHHGPYPGSRAWLLGNGPRFYLRDLMLREIINGDRPPDLVTRAHHHVYVEERVRIPSKRGPFVSWIVNTPSWTGLTDYAHQATRSTMEITNGLAVAEVRDGRLLGIVEMTETIDARTRETL